MKNLYFGIIPLLLFVGCVTNSEFKQIDAATSIDDECLIVPNILISGQIRYFDGMNLRLPSCPIVEKWEFANQDPPVARKIWSALNLNPVEPESDFLYVNIEFYVSTLPDGTVIIQSIEKAELTTNSIYD